MERVELIGIGLALIAIVLSSSSLYMLNLQAVQIRDMSKTIKDLEDILRSTYPAYAANIDWRQCAGEKIVIMVPKHMWSDSIAPLLPEFEKLSGITVDFVVYPEDLFYEKFWAGIAATKAPFDAAFVCPAFGTYPCIVKGALEPLDDYMNDPTLTDADWWDWMDFPAIQRDIAKEGTDKVYQLPVCYDNLGIMFYRKSILAKYNLDVPTTYEELLAAAKTITEGEAPGMYGIVLRAWKEFAWTGLRITMASYMGATVPGRGFYFKEDWTPRFNEARAIEGVKMYSDLLHQGAPGIIDYTWYDAMDEFATGHAAFLVDSNGFEYTFEDPVKSKVVGDVGYAVVPASKYGHYTMVNFWCMGMMKTSEQKKATWLFMEWVTSKDIVLRMGFMPARSSVIRDPAYHGALPYGYTDAVTASNEIALYADGVYCESNVEIFHHLGIALHKIYAGEDVATAMNELQQFAISKLQEEGKL